MPGQNRRKFPAEVDSVLQSEVQSLATGREVDVRGITGEEESPDAVTLRLPRRVAELGNRAGAVHTEVSARDLDHSSAKLVKIDGGVTICRAVVFRSHHPKPARLKAEHGKGAAFPSLHKYLFGWRLM